MKSNTKFLGNKGFTFIEIMVVVTISMVITGFGLAQYREFQDKQTVIRASENFVTALRSVQKRADAGERVDDCHELDSYTVRYVSERDFQYADVCVSGTSGTNSEVLKLSGNTRFLASFPLISFPVLSGDITGPATIVIISPREWASPGSGYTCAVVLSPAGEIAVDRSNCG